MSARVFFYNRFDNCTFELVNWRLRKNPRGFLTDLSRQLRRPGMSARVCFNLQDIWDNCSFELVNWRVGKNPRVFLTGLSRQLPHPGMSARVFFNLQEIWQLQFRACQLTGGEESEGFFDRTLKAITSSVDECAGFLSTTDLTIALSSFSTDGWGRIRGFFNRNLEAITSSGDECAGFFIIYKIFDNCSFELCQLTGGEESAGFFSGLSRQLCRPGMSARVF